jgi:hypothetical protein
MLKLSIFFVLTIISASSLIESQGFVSSVLCAVLTLVFGCLTFSQTQVEKS